MSGRFAGQRALVTGASRGIGAAVAQRLAAEGADVAIVARTLEPDGRLPGSLSEVRDRLSRYGGNVHVVVADLADEADRARIVPAAVDGLDGPITILVNNAAAAVYQPLADFPLRRRRLTFEVNVHAPFDLAQQVIPGMRAASAGWIVNLTSATARHAVGPPFDTGPLGATTAVYGASKAALNRITNGLAVELATDGIRVNGVEPRAAVLSEGAERLAGAVLRPEQIESMEEMVEAVVALCDCPAEVTGQCFVSLDLLADWAVPVRDLDGAPRAIDGGS